MSERDESMWKEKIDKIMEGRSRTRSALLPCLEAVQRETGCIPQEAITYIRKELDVPSVNVYGVITFYGMLTTKKQGKYVIRVCNSLPCYLNGSQEIIEVLKDELGIGNGEITSDEKFTLEEVACLGLCDKAPAIMVNEEICENLTKEKVRDIIRIKREEG